MQTLNISIDDLTAQAIKEEMQKHIDTALQQHGLYVLGLVKGDSTGKVLGVYAAYSEEFNFCDVAFKKPEFIIGSFEDAYREGNLILGVAAYVGEQTVHQIPYAVSLHLCNLSNLINNRLSPYAGITPDQISQKDIPYFALAINEKGIWLAKTHFEAILEPTK